MRKTHVILVVLILAAASWLPTLADDGLGLVWTHNVVRNWEQFGMLNLHGELVYNPGGYQVETQPQIYAGHHATGLYPFFLMQKFFPWPGATFLYYGLAAAVVFWSIWQLLGRTKSAFWLGGIAVLTPGYLRWQVTLDPNLASVLAGFPFCVAVIRLLQEKRLGLIQIVLLLLLIILYSAVNWSTVFIQAMLFATLLLLRGVSWRNFFIYLILSVVPAMIIVSASVMEKMATGHHGSGGGFSQIYGSYGWGSSGYGQGLITKTAILRLSFVNFIGLLPVILFLGWELWRGRTGANGKKTLFCLLPLLAAIFSVAMLRNYFGHHPWMSCNFILLGMILSFFAWKSSVDTTATAVAMEIKPVWLWTTLTMGFAYGFIVLLFYQVHNEQELELAKLIRLNTMRSATILITRDSDPELAAMQDRLPELFDRHVVVLQKIPDDSTGMTNKYWLTAGLEKRDGYQMVADNGKSKEWPLFKAMLGWYSRVIARRRPGDKMDFAAQYYLYQ